jgi:peptidoglycan/xylan/chitin deacetylase (PgdA/CDA1 family)
MVRTLAGGVLALFTCLLASAKGAQLNAGYLLPGSSTKIDRQAIAASRFCALTFDDGPDDTYTPQVAAILDRFGIKGTFFVVGQRAAGRPEQVRALHRGGHEIANHSWSHPDFTTLSAPQRKREIMRTQELLEGLGVRARWFRPPFGAFDRSVIKSCEGCSLRPVLWSVDPRDWQLPGADRIASRVLGGSGNGAVILLHSTNAQSVEALPKIIEGLRERGYTFLTMTQWEAAAQGRDIPAAGNGAPPSLRESAPWLPEAPEAPGGGLPTSAAPRVEKNAADPQWVEAMNPEFYAPVVIREALPAESTVEATATLEDVASLEDSAGAVPTADRASPVPTNPGPALFILGNFDQAAQAQWILDHERAGKVRQAR